MGEMIKSLTSLVREVEDGAKSGLAFQTLREVIAEGREEIGEQLDSFLRALSAPTKHQALKQSLEEPLRPENPSQEEVDEVISAIFARIAVAASIAELSEGVELLQKARKQRALEELRSRLSQMEPQKEGEILVNKNHWARDFGVSQVTLTNWLNELKPWLEQQGLVLVYREGRPFGT